jgi:hypothetical protein
MSEWARGARVRVVSGLAAVALVVGGTSFAAAAAAGGQARLHELASPPGVHRVHASPGGRAPSAGRASGGGDAAAAATPSNQPEFSTVDNPTSLDPPVRVPPTTPVVVTIADHAAFGNAPPPAVTTTTLPRGRWAEVVLDVTGTEQGVQYDRLCEIFAGPSEIFLGVTPEPTAAGITWHVQKDVTGYLPLLEGRQTFSTYVDNYTNSTDTGVPVITAKLLFYPAGGGFQPVHTASITNPAIGGAAIDETGPASPAEAAGVPSQAVPLLPTGATNTLNLIGTDAANTTVSATVSLPSDVSTIALDLYAVGQIGDEFWWAESPAFREIEVSIDGTPAGVVWPFPYVYTGGINPLIWQPVTGIHTLDIPSYRLDLTPFAGMLAGGTHTISLTVVNNAGYWLGGGSLLLTTAKGTTGGRLLADTLSFPGSSQVVTQDANGDAGNPVFTESASRNYEIAGSVTIGHRTYVDTLTQRLQFENDQSNIDYSCSGPCYQWVHGEETQATSETVTGPGTYITRTDRSSWTIDAPNGDVPDSGGFFLPAAVNQQLTDVATQVGGLLPARRTSLSESIIGYGALQAGGGPNIENGDTTGTVTYASSDGSAASPVLYQRTVVASGGVIEQNLVQRG